MSQGERALIAVSDETVFEGLAELLEVAGVEAGRALDRETALALGFRQSFKLVVCDLPMRGAGLRDFLAQLTGSGALSAGAPVALYGHFPGAARFDGAGKISQCRTLPELRRVVAGQLGLGDRVARRLLVQVELGAESPRVRRAMQTENVSATGMLLRTRRLLPLGSVVPFCLDLPLEPDPVEGRAEVVRHTDPGVEGVVGMGLRFVEVDEPGGERLATFVAAVR